MALAALLFVLLITVAAIALAVFPPHKVAQWFASSGKDGKKR
jgi:uncharacterized membrane protein YdjX (TVP38/TMEM64 family)